MVVPAALVLLACCCGRAAPRAGRADSQACAGADGRAGRISETLLGAMPRAPHCLCSQQSINQLVNEISYFSAASRQR